MTAAKSNHITEFYNVAVQRLTSRLEGDLPHPRVVGTTTINLHHCCSKQTEVKTVSQVSGGGIITITVTSHANQADKHQQYSGPAANIRLRVIAIW